jgi:hypothetical protein
VNGSLSSQGMCWDLALDDVNAGMPITVQDMYNLKHEESLYIIRPFDIECNIQNLDKTQADMNVNVEIKPELRGELTAMKLDRFMIVLSIAQDTLFKQPLLDMPAMMHLKALDVLPVYYKEAVATFQQNQQTPIRKISFADSVLQAMDNDADHSGDTMANLKEGGDEDIADQRDVGMDEQRNNAALIDEDGNVQQIKVKHFFYFTLKLSNPNPNPNPNHICHYMVNMLTQPCPSFTISIYIIIIRP